MRTVIATAAALPAVWPVHAKNLRDVTCAGAYRHHLQGTRVAGEAIVRCFTMTLVRSGVEGQVLLVTDAVIRMLGRHGCDCPLAIEGLPRGRVPAAGGRCDRNTTRNGCTGSVRVAVPAEQTGLTFPGQGNPR